MVRPLSSNTRMRATPSQGLAPLRFGNGFTGVGRMLNPLFPLYHWIEGGGRIRGMISEDVGGFLIPRTALDASRGYLYGQGQMNIPLARERFLRESFSMVTDIFLPGFAGWAIGALLDQRGGFSNKFVNFNTMELFQELAQESGDEKAFLTRLTEQLRAATRPASQTDPAAVRQLLTWETIRELNPDTPKKGILVSLKETFSSLMSVVKETGQAFVALFQGEIPQTQSTGSVQDAGSRFSKRLMQALDQNASGFDLRIQGKTRAHDLVLDELIKDLAILDREMVRALEKAGGKPWKEVAQTVLGKSMTNKNFKMMGLVAGMAATGGVSFLNNWITRKYDKINYYPGEIGLQHGKRIPVVKADTENLPTPRPMQPAGLSPMAQMPGFTSMPLLSPRIQPMRMPAVVAGSPSALANNPFYRPPLAVSNLSAQAPAFGGSTLFQGNPPPLMGIQAWPTGWGNPSDRQPTPMARSNPVSPSLDPAPAFTPTPAEGPSSKRFNWSEWFPYLHRCVKENKWLPFLGMIPMGIIALGGFNTVSKKFMNPMNLTHMRRVFDFSKAAPFTTQQQMAWLYSVLILGRLASSRGSNEFRERWLDGYLSWGLWIMGTPALKLMAAQGRLPFVSKAPALLKTMGQKAGGQAIQALRSPAEIKAFLSGPEQVKALALLDKIGLVSLVSTILSLGIFEPLLAILWTRSRGKDAGEA